jgi:hypothetical protein
MHSVKRASAARSVSRIMFYLCTFLIRSDEM